MSDEADKGEKRGFKVEDRRRFSETGEARSDRPEDDVPPPTAAEQSHVTAQSSPERNVESSWDAGPSAGLDLSFSTFVISLSTQALAHLGEIPNLIDNSTAVDLHAAKQLIDILGILKDKTKGNLDPAESKLLDDMLYDLRIKYVERARQPQGN